jgi:hypothetical protein
MIKYRIYTEDKNRQAIAANCCNYLTPGYTLFVAAGVWQGIPEKSLVIEFITEKRIDLTIISLCTIIKNVNKQEAVLYTMEEVESGIV